VYVLRVLGCFEFQIVIVLNLNIVNTIYMVIQITKQMMCAKHLKCDMNTNHE
jgi:hypothetical protein